MNRPTRISDVSRDLADRALEVCRHLLPNGRQQGQEYECGNVGGEAGKSLKVHLTGDKAGVWGDFAAGQSGDLIDLWAACCNLDKLGAAKEASEWMGRPFEERKAYKRPEPAGEDPDSVAAVGNYLREERGLSHDALTLYQVKANARGEMIFPSYRDGELISQKYINIKRAEDGKKIIRRDKDSEPCLFGWQAIAPDATEVTICEGEIDALSLWMMGIPALSVPIGAGVGGKHTWIEGERERLARFERIYLCMDMDEEGQKAAQDIAARLGVRRCYLVELPLKDANECLLAGLNAEDYFAAAAPLPDPDPAPVGFRWLSVSEILEPLPPVSWKVEGIHLAAGRPFMFAGYGASMKTLTCQALAVAAAAGEKVWGHFPTPGPLRVRHVDSEQGVSATRRRYQRLIFAANLTADQLGNRLQVVSFPPVHLSQPGAESAWRGAAEGCDILILDSLRALTPGVDENSSEIRRCLDPLTRISEETGCAIVLVHHAKKSGQADQSTSVTERLRGSSGIFDACGAVFFLDGKGQEPRKVEQVKTPADAAGGIIEPFWLAVEDVPNDKGDPFAGVRVFHQTSQDTPRKGAGMGGGL
jgi:hypothetical protein